MKDYFEMCERLPAKPRFAVGDQVRIIGPSQRGTTAAIGAAVYIDHVPGGTESGFYNVKPEIASSWTYHESSLAHIAEVPAPKFKRGDVLQKNPNGPRLTVANIEWDGKIWLYVFGTGTSTLVVAEEYLSPAPVEPTYLPTRYTRVGREKHNGYFYTTSPAYESRIVSPHADHTHIIHDMPVDKDGVQVDFVTLTEAGYIVAESIEKGRFFWKQNCGPFTYCPTAIDAWRAAATHYLASKK